MAGYLDLCRFIPDASGLGDWVVDHRVQGYLDDLEAGAIDGEEYHIRSETADMLQWEVSTGVYDQATNTFARTTIEYSSDGGIGGNKIDFTSIPQCAVVLLAQDLGFARGYRGIGPPDENVT
jgi:hypothetical protein